MISLILGENLFQQGISSFFATNKDGFINSDLWKLLTIAGHRSGALSMNVRFQDVVDSWVVLTGFPVLVVDYNNNEEKVALHQEVISMDNPLILIENGCDDLHLGKDIIILANLPADQTDFYLFSQILKAVASSGRHRK
ncbi:aminopeptidase N-like isoform X2 [Lycorma delicatula]|uniref:aminopeptidase N-like isoform X2 n=1 Tax=Lycorma delicatula TaxID=130591 RepID=UPI003F519D39